MYNYNFIKILIIIILIILIILIIFIYFINSVNYSPYILFYINFIFSKFINNKEYINIDNLDWTLMLKKNYKIILNEYINYIKNNGKLKRFRDMDTNKKFVNTVDIGNIPWEVLILKFYNKNTDKIKYFPKTYNLISKIPGCSLAMFSILPPGKKLEPHYGPFKGVLRYHIGLIIPNKYQDCYLLINDKKYNWREGEDVMFDDTFLHSVENNTDETRVVFFLDIKRNFNNILLDSFNSFLLYFLKFNENINVIVKNTNN
jgi:beta-hydroxylase